MNRQYLEGESCTIHSLGPSYGDRTFRGFIRGLAVDGPARIYIVELKEVLDPAYPYSCCTVPEACLRHGWGTR